MHASRFIAAAGVVENVTDRLQIAPMNIEQTRPLAQLEPEQQRKAWQMVIERAADIVVFSCLLDILCYNDSSFQNESGAGLQPTPNQTTGGAGDQAQTILSQYAPGGINHPGLFLLPQKEIFHETL